MNVPGSIGLVLASTLIAFYVLLPLDLGFPTVPLFGRPLNSAVVATLVVFWVVALQSRGAALSHLREPYSIVQSVYFFVLVGSSLRSASPPSALHRCVLYYSTFVLNYVILRYVTRVCGTRWLSAFVVMIGVAGAAIGIVQGVMGITLPIYDAWFGNYFGSPAENYALANVRAVGTMNNPILYSVAMVLVIPYALDLKQRPSRVLAVFAVLLAAGLSGSRTALLVVAVFVSGAIAVYRRRALWALPSACLGLVLLVQSLGGLSAVAQNSRVAYLLERVGLSEESEVPVLETPSITLRREALVEGIREMSQEWGGLTWIVGRGQFTSASIGQKVSPGYNTVDNAFFGVLYEQGLSGLVLFVGAFVTCLIRTRRASTMTLHWYAPLGLALAGFSFNFDAYSTFNILAVGSMAVAMWHAEQARGHLERRRAALKKSPTGRDPKARLRRRGPIGRQLAIGTSGPWASRAVHREREYLPIDAVQERPGGRSEEAHEQGL